MALFYIKKDLYKQYEVMREFEKKAERPYFLIELEYRENKQMFGVPLQANIHKSFQEKGYYVQTPNTNHTRTGKIGGWNIAKMVPLNGSFIRKAPSYPNLKEAEKIAVTNKQYIMSMARKILDNYCKGAHEFGVINIDYALHKLNLLDASHKKQNEIQVSHQERGEFAPYQDLSSASQSDLSGYVGKESAAVISKETQQDLHTTQNKNQPQQVGQVEQVGLAGQVGQAQKSQNNVKQKAKAPNSAGKR